MRVGSRRGNRDLRSIGSLAITIYVRVSSDELMVSGLKGLLESAGLYSNLDSSDGDDEDDSDVSEGDVEDFSIGERLVASGRELLSNSLNHGVFDESYHYEFSKIEETSQAFREKLQTQTKNDKANSKRTSFTSN